MSASGANAVDLASRALPVLSETAKASAFGGFISFDKRQKKRNQRKTLSRQSKPMDSLLRAISRLGILPRLETAHIHVRRPAGLDQCAVVWLLRTCKGKIRRIRAIGAHSLTPTPLPLAGEGLKRTRFHEKQFQFQPFADLRHCTNCALVGSRMDSNA